RRALPVERVHAVPVSASASLFFYCSGAPRALHSFPTRRSSDLGRGAALIRDITVDEGILDVLELGAPRRRQHRGAPYRRGFRTRSEEHTSELQSLAYLVCRLLLEKKNTTETKMHNHAPSGRPVL